MSDARHAVQAEIYRVLMADAALTATLAGPRVHDAIPHGAPYPFVSFADMRTKPLDGDGTPTVEHRIDLVVHSRAAGRREASDVADRVRAVLADAALSPAGHRLVSIAHSETDVTASRSGRAFSARLRFRALTEAN